MKAKKPTPTFGSAKGQIKIANDFDETPEGFEPYLTKQPSALSQRVKPQSNNNDNT